MLRTISFFVLPVIAVVVFSGCNPFDTMADPYRPGPRYTTPYEIVLNSVEKTNTPYRVLHITVNNKSSMAATRGKVVVLKEDYQTGMLKEAGIWENVEIGAGESDSCIFNDLWFPEGVFIELENSDRQWKGGAIVRGYDSITINLLDAEEEPEE